MSIPDERIVHMQTREVDGTAVATTAGIVAGVIAVAGAITVAATPRRAPEEESGAGSMSCPRDGHHESC